jgi:hypothetical protein
VRIEGEDSPYFILDTAGAELRREPCLDHEKAWIEARIASAGIEQGLAPARRLRR